MSTEPEVVYGNNVKRARNVISSSSRVGVQAGLTSRVSDQPACFGLVVGYTGP